MNILCIVFIFMSVFTGLIGLLVNYVEPYLPVLLTRTFRYGKFSAKMHHAIVAKLEIPKKWFGHFYIFAAPMSSVALCLVSYKCFYNGNVPEIVITLLDALLGSLRQPLISAENAILAIVLYNVHCWKRLYESYYINVFSDQKIHIFHYSVGYVHYLGILLCIIGEFEGFVGGISLKNYSHISFSLHKLTTVKLICALICLWATYMQLKSNMILARLRKNEHGDVISKEHKIPVGGLFKYISNPLQFTEMLIYIMLSIILWQASTYHYVTIWVIVNQVVCAFFSHQWYHRTFKHYPKERKIIIPYIW